ncbi:MAG: phosphoribosylformylglycinamidine synthase II, partial [Rubrobacteraceae bacterium]|nr:phosphoribosylformylglycinamidine synthase II [Rubrobacteraceae bacterium]
LADAPVYERDVVRPRYLDDVPELDLSELPEPEDYNSVLLQMLGHPNLRSRRPIFTQYDHQVGTDTVVLPGADAAVVRIKGTDLGFAATTDGRGRHCYLDPRGGGAATVVEAYRNLSCVGAEPVAVTDCLNFGSPEKPDGYYQLAECIEGMSEACEVFGTAVVSGNVSLYNETDRGAIYPTPTVGMVGVLDDVSRHATPAFKRKGDRVVVIGKTPPLLGESLPSEGDLLAGSEYLEIIHGKIAGLPQRSDLAAEKKVADLVRELVRSGLVDTAHDISGGGEAVALAKMAIEGGIGFDYDGEVEIEDLRHELRGDVVLFGETNPDFIVAVPEVRWDDLQDALIGFAYDLVGTTGGDRFKIGDLIDVKLSEMREVYERDLFESHAPEGGRIG